MPIEVRCPNGHVLHVKRRHAGKIGICPHCCAPVRVPVPGQVQGHDRPGVPAVGQHLAEKLVHEQLRHERTGDTSDSSPSGFFTLAEKGKLCLECGKLVSHSFSFCTCCGTPVFTYHHLALRRAGDVIVVEFGKHQILIMNRPSRRLLQSYATWLTEKGTVTSCWTSRRSSVCRV